MSDRRNKSSQSNHLHLHDANSYSVYGQLEQGRYRTLIESTRDWLWEVDDKMVYTYASPQIYDILGYTPEEVTGKTPFDFMPAEENKRIEKICKPIIKTRGDMLLIEKVNLHKKGRQVYLETSGKPYYTADGKFCGYRGVDRDISARKQLEQERGIYSEAMRQISEAALYLDSAGKIIYLNQGFYDVFGYTPDEILYKPISMLGSPSLNGVSHPKDTIKALNETGAWEGETSRLHKNGSAISVYLKARTVYDDDGKIIGYVGSYHDLSRLKQDEEKLQVTLKATIQAIANTIEKRDPYTFGHVNRVAQLSLAIAKEMGKSKEFLKGLEMGALIHDIGKIYIPSEILNRPGKITEYEMSMIKTHSTVGYEIVQDIDFPWPISEMVLQHHERLDGSGYPNGLSGNEIIPEAKIISVADVMEAMSSHRPYRPALKPELGLSELESSKDSKYDAEVVDICHYLYRKKHFNFA